MRTTTVRTADLKVGLYFLCLLAALAGAAPHAQQPAASLDDVLNALPMRNIGAFRTGAWVTAIDVPESPAHDHLYTIYAASRSGGLWKTTNGGITWNNITDTIGLEATGAVAIAPSDPSTVWVGGGDQANARSSISGKGVFKSTDAGKTWQFMGLPESHHIARIVIHPKNPDIVYVAAIGHLFTKNDERGVYRTMDGGKTWKRVLYVNDGVGAVDLVINRKTPTQLFAAMYDKDRKPWQIVESGPESGLFRTDDAGDKWTKLTGGLPTGKIGRIGVDIYQKNPLILYALLENQNLAEAGAARAAGAGGAGRGAGAGAAAGAAGGQVSAVAPLAQGIIGNEIYRTDDGGKTWRKLDPATPIRGGIAGGKAPYSFNQLKIDPHNDQTVIVTSDSMYITRDGGKTWGQDFFRGAFGDFRCMWWDETDEQRILLGSDGGVQLSNDGGRTSDYAVNLRVGEVYAVGVDMDDPYNVYGGLQDHDSWKGPSNGPTGRISLENWVTVGPGDGMYNVVDPTDSRWVYNTRELNAMGRMDQKTGIRTNIAPGRPAGQPRLRYNWIAPIALSPFNPRVVYAGAQVLFRSLDRGDHWEEISPDLTTNDPAKTNNNVPFCTITTMSESPLTAGLIWVGTDDGKVWVTKNHGGQWTDLTQTLTAAGAPVDRWVSRVFASPHDPGTAFVSKNGFRNDDFTPYLYRTTDYGQTWTPITATLPTGAINVVVQDRKNKNLLFIGTDMGVFVSIDGAATWTRFTSNLPTVAVHDLLIHPRENDLVIGTYGRGFWVGDISPLQDLTPDTFTQSVHLFDIEPKAHYGFGDQGMNYHLFGNRYIEVPNEPDAMMINYWSKEAVAGGARITVTDIAGRQIAQLNGPVKPGLNRVLWNMTAMPAAAPAGAAGRGTRAGGAGGGGGRGGGGGALAAPGDYLVTLEIGADKQTKVGKVRERIW